MKKYFALVLFILALLSQSASAFSDVPANFYQYKAITWLSELGDVKGYSDGTFKPNRPINRAEFLKILYQATPMTGKTATLPFRDVPSNAWFTPYVKEAYATGLVSGYADGIFKPEKQITLAEALKILITAFPTDHYYYNNCGNSAVWNPAIYVASQAGSVDINAWYWQYISDAGGRCILTNDYSPIEMSSIKINGIMTRGDIAVMLYRAKNPQHLQTVSAKDKERMAMLGIINQSIQAYREDERKYPENAKDNTIPLEAIRYFQGGVIPKDPDGTSFFYHKDTTNPECFILGAQMDNSAHGNSKDNVVQNISNFHCNTLAPTLVDGSGTGFYMIFSSLQ